MIPVGASVGAAGVDGDAALNVLVDYPATFAGFP